MEHEIDMGMGTEGVGWRSVSSVDRRFGVVGNIPMEPKYEQYGNSLTYHYFDVLSACDTVDWIVFRLCLHPLRLGQCIGGLVTTGGTRIHGSMDAD